MKLGKIKIPSLCTATRFVEEGSRGARLRFFGEYLLAEMRRRKAETELKLETLIFPIAFDIEGRAAAG
jgi:hypothetical protein